MNNIQVNKNEGLGIISITTVIPIKKKWEIETRLVNAIAVLKNGKPSENIELRNAVADLMVILGLTMDDMVVEQPDDRLYGELLTLSTNEQPVENFNQVNLENN